MTDTQDVIESTRDVPGLLRFWAELTPDRNALVLDDKVTISYAELDHLSSLLAGEFFRIFDGKTGEAVLCAFSSADWIDYAITYIAIQKSGNVPVVMRHSMVADEYKYGAATTRGIYIVCGPAGLPRVQTDIAAIKVSRAGINQLAPLAAEHPGTDEVADILFSSGTGGIPSAVPAKHADIIPSLEGRYGQLHLQGRAGHAHQKLILYPIGTMGARLSFASNIFVGGTAFVLSQFRPDAVVDIIARYRLQEVTLVPPWAHRLAEYVAGTGRMDRLDSLRRIMISGSKTPAGTIDLLHRTFHGVELLNVYGSTETGRAFIAGPLRADNARSGKIGRPVAGVRVRAVDDAGRVLLPGEPGRIQIASPGTPSAGALSSAGRGAGLGAAHDATWVDTGDIGYIAADGTMFLVDREKDIVIVGGLNVSSLEVENVIREHPAVRDVAVVGAADKILGECIVAVVVPSGTVTERELKILARKRLANYKVPSRIIFQPELPVNHMGKVLKQSLRARLAAGSLQPEPMLAKTDTRDDSPAS